MIRVVIADIPLEKERSSSASSQEETAAARCFRMGFTGFPHDFSIEAVVPESWDCPKCGLPASVDSDNPPPAPKIEPYKTHLAYVKERRSDAEAKEILEEAVALLRSRRKSGDIIF